MEFKVLSILVAGSIISVSGGYFTWKHADFFLTKREHYLNSRYELLKKKLSLSLSIAGLIFFISILAAGYISDKSKKQVNKQKIEMKMKHKK